MKKIKFNKNKTTIKRKKIPAKIRMAVIALLGILTLASLVNVVAISSAEPTTTEKNIPLCNYNHQGEFNYMVYLKNNTVYETTVLHPGQATIFKKITDHINASFSYRFDIDCSATIQGSYKLVFQLQTDIWSKEYTIIQKTKFDTNNFNINFQINTTHYENIIKTINEETGVPAQNPTLNITCEITITAQTNQENIYETFTPKLSIPVGGNTIEINGDLTQTKTGAVQTTIQIQTANENQGSSRSLITAVAFFLPIIPFMVFTKNDYTTLTETEKQINKIKKKYREWLVEIDNPPKMQLGIENVTTKSLEDLIKTSEELGKPLLYYSSPTDKTHTFYVLDDTIHYQYVFEDGN